MLFIGVVAKAENVLLLGNEFPASFAPWMRDELVPPIEKIFDPEDGTFHLYVNKSRLFKHEGEFRFSEADI